MARPDQEAIDTFMSITGASESVAVRTLEAHGGDLNQAVNAHFSEGDRNATRETSNVAPQDDAMDIGETISVGIQPSPFPLLPSARNLDPFSLLDPGFTRRFFDSGPDFRSSAPFVSHPREVREIPIEVKDGGGGSGRSGIAPTIEDVSGTDVHGPETHGLVTIDDDDDEEEARPNTQTRFTAGPNEQKHDVVADVAPSAPGIDDLPDYENDVEEEMIRAAIEASKRENSSARGLQPGQSHEADPDLAHAVSLSLKTAEQENALRELGGSSDSRAGEAYKSKEIGDTIKTEQLNGRLDVGRSSLQDESEDVVEEPLVRHMSRRIASTSTVSEKEVEEVEDTPPSSPGQPDYRPQSRSDFPEWGGISSEEHDEAVMLEAAMFGGIPETSGNRFPYTNSELYPQTSGYRPPSPSVVAQRQIREQQDGEFFASLQADREKAEARRLEEEAAREASLEAERRKEEESHRKLVAEQEIERQLAAKEASLPPEPSSDDEDVVALLVKMPDGSRRGRRFLKSDKLQCLFDFIDVGRGVVKPGTYKLVRSYPRRAFSDRESSLSLNEVGLTSKQEALFLELIKP